MQKIDTPEERTVGRNGGTHASAVSKQLMQMGYVKFHHYDTDRGGYHCSNWGTDSQGGILVKVEFRRPQRGLKGKPSEDTINRVRRAKLVEMTKGLRAVGYYVSWGWDEETGDPDTTFIVVSVNPARSILGEVLASDPEPNEPNEAEEGEEGPQEQQEAAPEPELLLEPLVPREGLWAFLISISQVEETVREIHRAHNLGKDDVARRLEHTLYQKVLLAIVARGGAEDSRDLAAAALATQHLSFAR